MSIDSVYLEDIENSHVNWGTEPGNGPSFRRAYVEAWTQMALRLWTLGRLRSEFFDERQQLVDEVRQLLVWLTVVHLQIHEEDALYLVYAPLRVAGLRNLMAEAEYVVERLDAGEQTDDPERFASRIINAFSETAWHPVAQIEDPPPPDDEEEGDAEQQEIERVLREYDLENVGLNADWSVSAYLLGPPDATANRSDGAYYLLDNEDGSWTIVRRWYLVDDVVDLDERAVHAQRTLGVIEAFEEDPGNDVVEDIIEIPPALPGLLGPALHDFFANPPW